jgi:hypothetical protein
MRAAYYDHTETIDAEVTALNTTGVAQLVGREAPRTPTWWAGAAWKAMSNRKSG